MDGIRPALSNTRIPGFFSSLLQYSLFALLYSLAGLKLRHDLVGLVRARPFLDDCLAVKDLKQRSGDELAVFICL